MASCRRIWPVLASTSTPVPAPVRVVVLVPGAERSQVKVLWPPVTVRLLA